MFSVLGAEGRESAFTEALFQRFLHFLHVADEKPVRAASSLPLPARLHHASQTAARMHEGKVWLLLASILFCPLVQHQGRLEGVRVNKLPPVMRVRNCADRPEELLEQLYGRLTAGMLSAFHHTLQLEPLGKENISCPAGGRGPADKKQRLPINLNSISPWAYRISYDPARYPKYIPEAYCLCKGCLTGVFGEEDFRFRSAPVYMPTVILRRTSTCVGGRYIYVEDYVPMAVGCTCVPDQEKGQETVNSSIDKEEGKLLLNKGDKPSSP